MKRRGEQRVWVLNESRVTNQREHEFLTMLRSKSAHGCLIEAVLSTPGKKRECFIIAKAGVRMAMNLEANWQHVYVIERPNKARLPFQSSQM